MKIKAELKEDLKKFIRERWQKKQEEVTIVAPYRLSTDEISQIIEQYPQLEGRKMTTIIDSSIIAGVIIKIGTRILDLSLANKIKNLQHLVDEAT